MSADKTSRWDMPVRIIHILAVLSVPFITVALIWIQSLLKENALGYHIEGPKQLLPYGILGGPVSTLFLYDFHIENVGGAGFKDLVVKYHFNTSSTNFHIVAMGRREDISTPNLPRYITTNQHLHTCKYTRLDRGDVDANWFITTEDPLFTIGVDEVKPTVVDPPPTRARKRQQFWRERKIGWSYYAFGVLIGAVWMWLLQKRRLKEAARAQAAPAHPSASI